jgi:hypothetical protein
MTAPARLILHIGPHKSATTLIQGALAGAEGQLRSEGLHYSRVGRHGNGQHQLAWAMYQGDRQVGLHTQGVLLPSWQDVLRELVELLDGARLLVSAEDLSQLLDDELDALASELDGVDVEVVAGFRDPAAAIPSLWQESVKWSRQWSLATAVGRLLRDDRITLLPLLERWRLRFGRRAMRLLVVPGVGPTSGVLENLASALDVECSTVVADMASTPTNASITMIHAEALRAVSIAMDPSDARASLPARQRAVQRLALMGDALGGGPPPTLSENDGRRASELRASICRSATAGQMVISGTIEDVAVAIPEWTPPPSREQILGALGTLRRHLEPDEHDIRAVVAMAEDRLKGSVGSGHAGSHQPRSLPQ